MYETIVRERQLKAKKKKKKKKKKNKKKKKKRRKRRRRRSRRRRRRRRKARRRTWKTFRLGPEDGTNVKILGTDVCLSVRLSVGPIVYVSVY